MTDIILEMKNIDKVFPGVKALSNVNFSVRRGTVHGLMGENGAGKSTLMKVLQGVIQPTAGTIIFNGKERRFNSVKQALDAGIAMIHQEMSPILDMTVAENIFLGREPLNKFGFVDHAELNARTKRLLDVLALDIPPATLMRNLSIANMQMVEIAKALSFESELIIMDEPTSAITNREVENLFRIIAMLKERGVTIIYITHKMEEVRRIMDEVTVLRDGATIGTEAVKNLERQKLITMMVGREVTTMFPKTYLERGEELLRIENFSDGKHFNNISFSVHAGEMLGLAGLMGAGRSEVMEAVFGLRPKLSGKVFIRGKEVNIQNGNDAIKAGLALLTEDRKATGLFLPLDIKDNMIMSNLKMHLCRNKVFLNGKKCLEIAQAMRVKLNVKTPSLAQKVVNLSGGNQQKVLVGRWLINNPDILIVDEPTRGIDVHAKAEIHKLLGEFCAMGKAIIMISSEMPEIIGMSDRVFVMYEGEACGELDHTEVTQERIMDLIMTKSEQSKKAVG